MDEIRITPEEADRFLTHNYPDDRLFIKDVSLTDDGVANIAFDRDLMMDEIGPQVRDLQDRFGLTEEDAIRHMLLKGAEIIPLIDDIQADVGCTWEEAIKMYFKGVSMSYPDGRPAKVWSFDS